MVVVGDIDRGGVFASFFGTTALLAAEDQALVAGYFVNKFRGDVTLLEPGLEMLRGLTGRPVMGVLPFRHGLGIDEEDGLRVSLRGTVRESATAPPHGADVLRIAVVPVPLMSNFTDVDALAAEPGVVVRFTDRPEELADADLVVLPGTRGTVRALEWLRDARARGRGAAARGRGPPGAGHLRRLPDAGRTDRGRGGVAGGHRGRARPAAGAGALRPREDPCPAGRFGAGRAVEGYEIHHGVAEVLGGEPLFSDARGAGLDGCRVGPVWGTHWHGSLESDGFRRAFLRRVAADAGRAGFVPAPGTSLRARCARSSWTGSAT